LGVKYGFEYIKQETKKKFFLEKLSNMYIFLSYTNIYIHVYVYTFVYLDILYVYHTFKFELLCLFSTTSLYPYNYLYSFLLNLVAMFSFSNKKGLLQN
jgi:hypothetical protein